ncbi:hypothetical protein D3C76_1793520 [compost metagenome]
MMHQRFSHAKTSRFLGYNEQLDITLKIVFFSLNNLFICLLNLRQFFSGFSIFFIRRDDFDEGIRKT